MTPDIREKAERLAAEMVDFLNANAVVFFSAEEGDQIAETLAIPYISQALLEAHKAGREEAAKLIEEGYERKVAKPYRDDGVRSKNDQCEHGRYMYEDCEPCAASAIRSLP